MGLSGALHLPRNKPGAGQVGDALQSTKRLSDVRRQR
jgi:hypothetical protein